MAGPQVKVEGMKVVRRNLRAVDKELPKGLKEIHRKVAEPVAEDARRRVRSRSGKLAGSIKASGTQTAARVQAGGRGRAAHYAPINHFGGYPGDYAGNPFLTDAITERERQSIDLYEDLLTGWLESVWQDSH